MKPSKASSLKARLTLQMVLLQAIVLIAFAGLAAIPICGLLGEQKGLDVSVYEEIAHGLTRDSAGNLRLEEEGRAMALTERYPELWFYVVDARGGTLQFGELSPQASTLVDQLPQLDTAYFPRIGPHGASQGIVQHYETSVGSIWLIGGGGPEVWLPTAIAILGNPIFLGLLLVLTAMTFFFIPKIVGQQLSGVHAIALEAHGVNVDQRGVRLSVTHVPSELHPLVGAVNDALKRLDEGMERRQRFLADAAHELRTPIAVLQTRLELLPNGPDRTMLLLDAARLTNLADQLLDLERLDTDNANFTNVNLADLAAQVTADMAPLALAAGDDISFDAEADDVPIAGDAPSLTRAITNLIQNAVVHGGANTAIRVSVGRNGLLSVSDTGPGIAEQYRKTIFEPFRRIVPRDRGAGLGLSLVKSIVDHHQGHISVSEAPGGGALFEMAIPVRS